MPFAFSSNVISADTLNLPRYSRNLGHRDALQLRRYRDEDDFETPIEGAGSLFTATCRASGKGREIPNAGTTWPQQSGMG